MLPKVTGKTFICWLLVFAPDPEGLAILIETINSYKTFLMKTLATTGGCLVTFVIWMMFLFSSKFRLDYEVVFLCLDLS